MEKLKSVKGAIFDLDGTLLDSMRLWEEIDRRFLLKRGIAMPDDYVSAVNPLGFYDAAEYTIRRFSLPDNPEDLVREWHVMSTEAYAKEIKLKPFCKETLSSLMKMKIKLGIATALDEEQYVPCLKNNEIYGLFDAYVSLKDVSRGKEYPDAYLKCAQIMGVSPSECAVFEDIAAGIRSANAGGFVSVGIYEKYSESDAEDIKRLADFYFDSFEDVLKYVSNK